MEKQGSSGLRLSDQGCCNPQPSFQHPGSQGRPGRHQKHQVWQDLGHSLSPLIPTSQAVLLKWATTGFCLPAGFGNPLKNVNRKMTRAVLSACVSVIKECWSLLMGAASPPTRIMGCSGKVDIWMAFPSVLF